MRNTILLIVAVLLLTGCTADYNLTINSDLTVDESVTIFNSNEVLENGYVNLRTGIMARVNSYYFTDQFHAYKYEVVQGDENSGAKFIRKHKSLESYFETFFVTNLFTNGIIIQNENLITIKADIVKDQSIFSEEELDYNFNFEYVNINIDTPYLITAGNYNSLNIEENKMFWKYTQDTLPMQIQFTFDMSKSLEKEIVEPEETSNNSNINIWYILIPIFVIMLAGLTYIYTLYKRNNKI